MEPINLTQLITQLYWPALLLAAMIVFRKPISAILKERKIRITLPGRASLEISAADAEKTLSAVFTEFYVVYSKLLHPSHKEYFQAILNGETKLRVRELIEGFDRKNEEHIGALRALRGLGLIEPKSGGPWKADSIIEVTKFGRVFVDYLKLKDARV
jgi:hypothetical protein